MISVLLIDDDSKICYFFETLLKKMGCRTQTANNLEQARELNADNAFDLILLDLELPDGNGLEIMPSLMSAPSSPEVIIITGTGDARGAETAFKHGAWDFVQKPFSLEDVTLPIQRAIKYREEKQLVPKVVPLNRARIVGESDELKRCLEEVGKAASTDASVIVTGETGTGKELFSRAIHENSKRAAKPFIAVDCGALPESILESTLFGHEKGAFTGASNRRDGLIVQADGGTLMLDEVGDMPMSAQKTFLRVLQERVVRPVGGKKEIPVNIRLISATNLDLDEMVKQKEFREDLLYRIRGMSIHLPPLRERKQDVEQIVLRKIEELTTHYETGSKVVSPELMDTLMSHDWPGNIRELLNVLEYVLASAGNDLSLVPKHLPPEYRLSGMSFEPEKPQAVYSLSDFELDGDHFPQLNELQEELERKYLVLLIEKAEGDWKVASRLSGISKSRLYRMLAKHRLPGFGTAV